MKAQNKGDFEDKVHIGIKLKGVYWNGDFRGTYKRNIASEKLH